MPSVINTNISSLNTQRNLNASQTSLASSIQRLSSGLRVNSAKDDAAGLAIAERMTAQIRGLNVAARNANDGVSLAQTAEGALGKVGEMVQRIRELAVQSSNATNNAEDRAALQAEVAQLTQEIDRVAASTNFNGTKLLNGAFTEKRFQVGADAGQSITVTAIMDAKLSGMGAATTFTRDGSGAPSTWTAITAGDIKINGVEIGAVTGGTDAATQAAAVAAAITAKSNETGVTATVVSGVVRLSSAAGAIEVEVQGTAAANNTGFTGKTTAGTEGVAAGSLTGLSIAGYGSAQATIRRADAALKQINTARADLGAVQSSFEIAIANIQTASENTSAARSRIMDTDFAAETANLSRAQILQQAGNAMLTQANQLPQQVLALLRN